MGPARSTSYYKASGRRRADETAVRPRIEAVCDRHGAYGYRRVARDGIEPSTRGFSIQRRARFGASKPKNRQEFIQD